MATASDRGELFDGLLADLAKYDVKPKLRWSPDGKYAAFLVRDINVAFVHRQGRNGVRVEPGIALVDLPKKLGALFVARDGRRPVGYVVDAKSSKTIAAAIELASRDNA